MPLEWSYNIIYHFLCLLKNPASLRSTFAVSGEFRPLMKNCCKALAMWLTPKKFPWLLFLSLFFLQLTSSRATATQGWRVGSDWEQASRAEMVSFFHLRPILTLSLPGCRQSVLPGQAGGEVHPITSSTGQPRGVEQQREAGCCFEEHGKVLLLPRWVPSYRQTFGRTGANFLPSTQDINSGSVWCPTHSSLKDRVVTHLCSQRGARYVRPNSNWRSLMFTKAAGCSGQSTCFRSGPFASQLCHVPAV